MDVVYNHMFDKYHHLKISFLIIILNLVKMVKFQMVHSVEMMLIHYA